MSTRDVLCEEWHTLNQTSFQYLLHISITQTTVTKIDKASPGKASSPEIQTLTPRGVLSRQEANLSCPDPKLYYKMAEEASGSSSNPESQLEQRPGLL